MNEQIRKQTEKIQAQYAPRKEGGEIDRLKELDCKVKRPAQIFAYVFGIIGTLVLGLGMCLAMKVLGDMMAIGIIIGVVGIVMISVNYFICQKILQTRKAKYGQEIMSLSQKILNQGE